MISYDPIKPYRKQKVHVPKAQYPVILRRYVEGKEKASVLAREYNVTEQSIFRILRRIGGALMSGGKRRNMRKVPLNEELSVVARYRADESVTSIAKSYDCSLPVIHKIIRKHKAQKRMHCSESGRKGGLASGAAKKRIGAMHYDLSERVISQADQKRTEERYAKPAHVVRQEAERRSPHLAIKPDLPGVRNAAKPAMMSRNGLARTPIRARFPPLPGEPGYVYADARR